MEPGWAAAGAGDARSLAGTSAPDASGVRFVADTLNWNGGRSWKPAARLLFVHAGCSAAMKRSVLKRPFQAAEPREEERRRSVRRSFDSRAPFLRGAWGRLQYRSHPPSGIPHPRDSRGPRWQGGVPLPPRLRYFPPSLGTLWKVTVSMDHSAGTGRGPAPRVMELAPASRLVSGSAAARIPASVRTPSKLKTSGLSMALSLVSRKYVSTPKGEPISKSASGASPSSGISGWKSGFSPTWAYGSRLPSLPRPGGGNTRVPLPK